MPLIPSLESLMRSMEDFSELVADAVIGRACPVKDDLTERQAFSLYGERWVRNRRDDGTASVRRVGNRTVYSRHNLDCIRLAEREHSRLIVEHCRESNQNTQ